jgi:FKBP-type peptidyl-prolyl cis-trans isomerase
MKRIILLACALPTVVMAQQKPKPVTPKPVTVKPVAKPVQSLKSSLDSLSYAFGASIGKNLKMSNVDNLNYDQLVQGFKDAMGKGGKVKMDDGTCNMVIQTQMQKMAGKGAEKEKTAGAKFMAENKKRKGVVTTASGLQYEIITVGTGIKPKATDTIVAHYAGSLTNGTEFESSYKNGSPITYPANQLVPGWTEALQMMPAGSKWRLFIPSDLGYGDRGSGQIPGGATLIFEMELLEVKPVAKSN